MPGQTCAVAFCKSNRLSYKKEGVKMRFHSFPKENPEIKNEWIRRCGRSDKFNANTSTVCALHFTDDDYERDLQHELLGKYDEVPNFYNLFNFCNSTSNFTDLMCIW